MVNDMIPPPNVMKARQIGLYNPNAYVRGSAVEALGKGYGVNAIKKARMEESEARARVERYASAGANVPYAQGTLTSEELAVHSEFTVDEDYEEEKEEEEAAALGGERVGSGEEQPEGPVPVAGAAATATAEEEAGDKPVEKEEEKKKKKKKRKVCPHRTNALNLY